MERIMSDIMPNGTKPKSHWTDKDWDVFTHWIKGVLHTSPVTVTFTKKDGTEREMRCTLDPELYPPLKPLAEGKVPRKESPAVMRVFDLDLKEWRSFTIKSVKHITFSLGKDETEDIPVDYGSDVAAAWPFPTYTKP
jgi:hypothetical protein